jgi:hypothetical protein
MNWARFIATIESDLPSLGYDRVEMDSDLFRRLLVRAYTEGFSEGLKRGRKAEDTHRIFRFLTEPTDPDTKK